MGKEPPKRSIISFQKRRFHPQIHPKNNKIWSFEEAFAAHAIIWGGGVGHGGKWPFSATKKRDFWIKKRALSVILSIFSRPPKSDLRIMVAPQGGSPPLNLRNFPISPILCWILEHFSLSGHWLFSIWGKAFCHAEGGQPRAEYPFFRAKGVQWQYAEPPKELSLHSLLSNRAHLGVKSYARPVGWGPVLVTMVTRAAVGSEKTIIGYFSGIVWQNMTFSGLKMACSDSILISHN